MLNENLRVGIIQTSLDHSAAWDVSQTWKKAVKISQMEEVRAKREIRHFFSTLKGLNPLPDIVLLPELSTPLGFEAQLKDIARKLECIVIAGLDYKIRNETPPTVSNEAIVIVPARIRGKKIASQISVRYVGKTYPAPGEETKLNRLAQSVAFQKEPTVWLFQSPMLGNFGIAVCYDFLDLDRIVLYRNKIQTLFILAYNRDINTFDHMAEAICRTVFCNVVVCNCGHFGGSMAVSPYYEPHKRTIYRHSGNGLPNGQVIQLPLSKLADHQAKKGPMNLFKNLPPGFSSTVSLKELLEPL